MKTKNILILAIMVTSVNVFAQMPKFKTKIDDLRKVKVIDELNLNEDKTAKYLALENRHRDEINTYNVKIKESLDRLELQLKTNATDIELQKEISQLEELEKGKLTQRIDYFKNLKSNLTQKEFAQYILIERNFNMEMKHRFKEMLKNSIRK